MLNIKFSYLYRDGGNYKRYADIIFGNPENLPLIEVQSLIRSKLIDGQWFYADDWQIPDLHFDKWDKDLDHGFHEYDSLSYTSEKVNTPLSLNQFCQLVRQSNWKY